MKIRFLKSGVVVLALSSLAASWLALATPNSTKPAVIFAQGDENNPAEFTLTNFSDVTRGISFQRPSSWTQDSSFKEGIRFVGGDEWLELTILDDKTAPAAYVSAFKLPGSETKLGMKPLKQGKFSAVVLSSKSTGSSSVTGKVLDLLTDRWVFSPKAGKLAVLTVTGPKKVFDWEGNRDMALSVRLK